MTRGRGRERAPSVGDVATTVLAAAGTFAATRVAFRLLVSHPPGGTPRWTRSNFAGREVSLLAGPATAAGLAAGLACAPRIPGRMRLAASVVAVACGLAGLNDDLRGSAARRGFRGHLRGLGAGELSTGVVKVAVIAPSALAAAWLVEGLDADRACARGMRAVGDAVVVAASANLANLLDLRPGRAHKAVLGAALPLAMAGRQSGRLAAAVTGAACALLAADLGERTMLGDAGANALGGVVGITYVAGRRPLAPALLVLLSATALSERVSFSRIIEANPLLRRVDSWGRRARVSAAT